LQDNWTTLSGIISQEKEKLLMDKSNSVELTNLGFKFDSEEGSENNQKTSYVTRGKINLV
jgi:hypothetical protein